MKRKRKKHLDSDLPAEFIYITDELGKLMTRFIKKDIKPGYVIIASALMTHYLASETCVSGMPLPTSLKAIYDEIEKATPHLLAVVLELGKRQVIQ